MTKLSLVSRFENRLRRNRFSLVTRLLSPLPRPIRILDVGGAMDFWQNLDYGSLGALNVTLLNVYPQTNLPANFRADVGDARCLQAYSRDDYDVVMSNSCIGHVGSFADQKRMADEIQRVGRRYFVQTPNHYYPVDWRTHVPLFHFLSVEQQAWWLHHFPVAHFGRMASREEALGWAARVRNLRRSELVSLFPGAQIEREKLFGFTKSFMVFHGF